MVTIAAFILIAVYRLSTCSGQLNRLVNEGDSVRLPCNRTVLSPVDWRFQSKPTEFNPYICIGGRLLDEYKDRFELNEGDYSLTIRAVQLPDSGMYYCIEDSGIGDAHHIQLYVDKRIRSTTEVSPTPARPEGFPSATSIPLLLMVSIIMAATCLGVLFLGAKRIKKVLNRLREQPAFCLCVEVIPLNEENHRENDTVFALQMTIWLHAELMELLLLKTFHVIIMRSRETHATKETAYSTLACVCSGWRQILSRLSKDDLAEVFQQQLKRFRGTQLPRQRQPTLYGLRSSRKEVCGVAQLGNKIFVASFECDAIQVFDLACNALPDIILNDLKEPVDIATCVSTGSLYVADCSPWSENSGCIWRVMAGNKAVKFLPRKLKSFFRPWTLSVRSGRLLVTTNNDEILLYNSEGDQLRHLAFPNRSVRHALETDRNTMIICYMEPQPEIGEVSVDGRLIRVFNDRSSICWPCYLSTAPGGKLMVVDRIMQHVLLLNSELQFECVLLDDHQLLMDRPRRLCYLERTRQLIVAHGKHNKIQVFAW